MQPGTCNLVIGRALHAPCRSSDLSCLLDHAPADDLKLASALLHAGLEPAEIELMGLQDRVLCMARDPVACATHFRHIVNALFKHLWRFDPTPGAQQSGRPGVFGFIEAFFGAVEEQVCLCVHVLWMSFVLMCSHVHGWYAGLVHSTPYTFLTRFLHSFLACSQHRGTLHIHVLLWIRGLPSTLSAVLGALRPDLVDDQSFSSPDVDAPGRHTSRVVGGYNELLRYMARTSVQTSYLPADRRPYTVCVRPPVERSVYYKSGCRSDPAPDPSICMCRENLLSAIVHHTYNRRETQATYVSAPPRGVASITAGGTVSMWYDREEWRRHDAAVRAYKAIQRVIKYERRGFCFGDSVERRDDEAPALDSYDVAGALVLNIDGAPYADERHYHLDMLGLRAHARPCHA